MNDNDLLRRLRYALDLDDATMLELLTLGGRGATRDQLKSWFLMYDQPGYADVGKLNLAALLDGLIVKHRGPREGGAAPPTSDLDNNLVLKKLRIALQLEEQDMIAIMKLAEVELSKGELSALFRKKGQKNYRECLDQFLRSFLQGLAVFRKQPPAPSAT